MANERVYETAGPSAGSGQKQTKPYSKRVIILFILAIGLLMAMITASATFKPRDGGADGQGKKYRTPPASGFAELASAMRQERKAAQPAPASPDKPEPRTQRIIIEGQRMERPQSARPSPRYYSNRDDAQAAEQLRTLKLQALSSKPVVDGFLPNSPSQPEKTGAGEPRGDIGGNLQAVATPSATGTEQTGAGKTLNGQDSKQSFLRGMDGGASMTPQGYSANVPTPQTFPYELKAGTIIPGILVSGVNSDLPGNVIGQVSENVWDTATGKYVLIPKGTRIIGVYDSQISFGQKRVLLVWNKLVFPNGTTLDISGSPGTDKAGYSGLSGRVNEHWDKMIGAALLSSVFVAGAEIVYDQDAQNNGDDNKTPRDLAAESLAGSILDMGSKLMDRAANIQPTITIRPGKRMGIFVQRDVVFPFPYF